MALQKLLFQQGLSRALRAAGAILETPFGLRVSSGQDATTSGSVFSHGDQRDSCQGEVFSALGGGALNSPEAADFQKAFLSESRALMSSQGDPNRGLRLPRELHLGTSGAKGRPLSRHFSSMPAHSGLPLFNFSCCKDNPLPQFILSTSCRQHSTAAATEEPNVDPYIAMHREQFLKETNRKVDKVQPVIRAYLREGPGKNGNKKERKKGLVPGVLFSGKQGHRGGDKRLISVGHKQLSAILQPLGKYFFSAMTWDLELYEGRPGEEVTAKRTVERVVPKSVHLHAGTDEPLNVTFMRVSPDEKITVDVPLLFLGEDACPGLKKGGRLNTVRRMVRYVCPGDKVPPYLEVDLSRLNIGQSVLLKDLPADPSLKLAVTNPQMPVLKISGRTQEAPEGGS